LYASRYAEIISSGFKSSMGVSVSSVLAVCRAIGGFVFGRLGFRFRAPGQINFVADSDRFDFFPFADIGNDLIEIVPAIERHRMMVAHLMVVPRRSELDNTSCMTFFC
jgi:hypothetical protein